MMLTGFLYGVFVTYLLGVIIQGDALALSIEAEEETLEPGEYKQELLYIFAWPIIALLVICYTLFDMITKNKGNTQ